MSKTFNMSNVKQRKVSVLQKSEWLQMSLIPWQKMWERRRQRKNNFIKLILIEVLEEGFCTKVLWLSTTELCKKWNIETVGLPSKIAVKMLMKSYVLIVF